jgi:hypothetical protein
MYKKSLLIFLTAILFLTTFAFISDADAIPAFARRNKISCMTCHAPFPKLKDYGADFAGDGMILKENEKDRDYITAGDDKLWLNRDFPLGARFDAYSVFEDTKGEDVTSDLQSPWGIKLLSGGALYKNIGYYFYFYMSERGEVAGIEDAYIHFDAVFGSNLDVMVGQFQTSDPLMKRELRLTFEDYVIYKQKIGLSNTNLAYDRGVMLVYGIDQTATELVGLVVNGNGKAEAGSDKKFDSDGLKNWGLRLNQDVVGLFNVGGYFYRGKEQVDVWQPYVAQYIDQQNKITYWGVDGSIGLGPLDVTGQYLVRTDTNPNFNDGQHPQEEKMNGFIIEATLSPQLDRSTYYYTFLYNRINHDNQMYDYHTATFNITRMIARNLKLMAEYTRDIENEANRFTFGMVSGF